MTVETAKAAEPIPYGSPVRLTDKGLRACKPKDMDGIAKRPWVRGESDSHYGRGEVVIYQTDGGVMAVTGMHAEWVELSRGRILDAAITS